MLALYIAIATTILAMRLSKKEQAKSSIFYAIVWPLQLSYHSFIWLENNFKKFNKE